MGISFENQMASDLMAYSPMIDRWLHARFPQVYSQHLSFDCHSNGMLEILSRGYTGICPQERQHIMFSKSLQTVGDNFKHLKLPEKLTEGYYKREVVLFKELNPNFINYLPLRRRRIWKARVDGQTMAQIAQALHCTINTVCVTCHHIRKSYVKWLAMKNTWLHEYIEHVPDRRYLRQAVLMRYEEGCGTEVIADRLGITPRYVCTLLYRARKELYKHGVSLPTSYTE